VMADRGKPPANPLAIATTSALMPEC